MVAGTGSNEHSRLPIRLRSTHILPGATALGRRAGGQAVRRVRTAGLACGSGIIGSSHRNQCRGLR